MTISNLQRLSIGQVGVNPGLLFLQSNSTNAQLQVPGALNPIVSMSGVNVNNGDALIANAKDGGEYYTVIVAANGQITLEPAGGSSGGFQYQNTFWLASNGNDANSGRSEGDPKATFAAIAPLLVAGIPTVINIVGTGVYPISSTFIVPCPLFINAPGAELIWSGAASGNMFFLNANSPVVCNCAFINGTNSLQIFRGFSNIFLTGPSGYCQVINGTRLWEDAHSVSGGVAQAIFNVNTEGSTFVFKFAGEQVINALNLGTSIINSQLVSGSGNSVVVNAVDFSGTLSGTADFIINIPNLSASTSITTSGKVNGIYGPTYGGITNTPVNLAGNPFGAGYQTNIVKRKIQTTSGTTIYLDHTMSGAEINLVDNTVIVGLQSYATEPNYPQGFYVDLVQNFQNSGCEISGVSLSDIFIRQPTSYPFFTGAGVTRVYLAKNATFVGDPNIWVITGNVFNSNLLTQTNIFISQIEGNDSTANGNVDSQFATINAALAYVIATYTTNPSYGINLVITDDAVYNEKLDFTGTSNIQIVGKGAQLIYSSSGPGDDGFTSDSPLQFVTVAELSTAGGGKTVNYTGSGALILNIDVIGNGNTENNGSGTIFCQSYVIEGALVNSGGGRFGYSTILRGGTDDPTVIGNAADGCSQNWTVKNNLEVVSGNATIDTGNLLVLTGLINANSDITSAVGNIVASAGNINASSGNIQAFQGSLIAGTNGQSGQLQVYPTLMNSGFLNLKATANTANVVTALLNQATSIATAHRLPNVALSDATLLVSKLTQIDPMSNLIYFDTTITAAQLSGGASVSLIGTFFGGQYRVRELFINSQGTNFSGGGGDRNVQIDDGATIFSIIPAATLQALVNNRWGSTDVPFPASASINTLTNPGVNLNIRYNGGTTDYAVGSVTISGSWEKVV